MSYSRRASILQLVDEHLELGLQEEELLRPKGLKSLFSHCCLISHTAKKLSLLKNNHLHAICRQIHSSALWHCPCSWQSWKRFSFSSSQLQIIKSQHFKPYWLLAKANVIGAGRLREKEESFTGPAFTFDVIQPPDEQRREQHCWIRNNINQTHETRMQ